jgi:hypothetical protein
MGLDKNSTERGSGLDYRTGQNEGKGFEVRLEQDRTTVRE